MNGLETLLTPQEVAEKLRISASSVYRFANKGTLPVVKIGNAIRFSPEALALAIKKMSDEAYGNAA